MKPNPIYPVPPDNHKPGLLEWLVASLIIFLILFLLNKVITLDYIRAIILLCLYFVLPALILTLTVLLCLRNNRSKRKWRIR